MKYKVGDKVRIKSLDWYNKNKDDYGYVWCTEFLFTPEHSKYCGRELTISHITEFEIPSYVMEGNGHDWTNEMIEGLVERNGKTYPYKIGDRVVLKGNNRCATITDLKYNSWGNLSYYIKIDNDKDISTDYPTELLLPYDNKVEGLVEEEVSYDIESEWLKHEISLPKGYIFKDENGNVINAQKIVLEKKRKEYPKTYEECAKIMNCPIDGPSGWLFNFDANIKDPYYRKIDILMGKFTRLLICRDAYWKIAGEEMGLGKPWEPDWKDDTTHKFIIHTIKDKIHCGVSLVKNHLLAFPTEEMRDAFYENFKEIINSCKELL